MLTLSFLNLYHSLHRLFLVTEAKYCQHQESKWHCNNDYDEPVIYFKSNVFSQMLLVSDFLLNKFWCNIRNLFLFFFLVIYLGKLLLDFLLSRNCVLFLR